MNVNEPIGFGRCPRCQHSLLVALEDGLCLSCAAEKILALEVACWTAKGSVLKVLQKGSGSWEEGGRTKQLDPHEVHDPQKPYPNRE